jgi:hypothetical protein
VIRIARAHGQAGGRVRKLVEIAPQERIHNGLDYQQQNKSWNRPVNQIGYVRHIFISNVAEVPYLAKPK